MIACSLICASVLLNTGCVVKLTMLVLSKSLESLSAVVGMLVIVCSFEVFDVTVVQSLARR